VRGSSLDEAGGKYLAMFDAHSNFINLKRIREFMIKSFARSKWSKYLRQCGEDSPNEEFDDFARRVAPLYKDPDYCTWLRALTEFHEIPRYLKYKDEEYRVCCSISLFALTDVL
jgi:hypothetical protein